MAMIVANFTGGERRSCGARWAATGACRNACAKWNEVAPRHDRERDREQAQDEIVSPSCRSRFTAFRNRTLPALRCWHMRAHT